MRSAKAADAYRRPLGVFFLARCNAIAAAILMPRDQVLANPEVAGRRAIPQSWDVALRTQRSYSMSALACGAHRSRAEPLPGAVQAPAP
ncbi:MAG: hypothetical protein ACRDS1_04385 [Pseudonocardiaceae bacterium]